MVKKRKSRRYFLVICLLAGVVFFGYWQRGNETQYSRHELLGRKDSFFVPIKIRDFSDANIPYIQVYIEGQKLVAKVDLGFQGELAVPDGILSRVKEKQFVEISKTMGVTGKIYSCPTYNVKEAVLHNYLVDSIHAEELNLEFEEDIQMFPGKIKKKKEIMGRLGWYVFRDFGLLVDCRRKTMALCSGFESLPRKYSKRAFVSTPLTLKRGGLEFEAVTEKGKWRCLLDTGCTYNLVTVNGKEGGEAYSLNPEDECEVPSFDVGGEEFGPITMTPIETPVCLDAILGMEFFKEHVVFIDFPNRMIYFAKN